VTTVEPPPPVEEPPVELPSAFDPHLWTPEHVTQSLGYAAVLIVALTTLAEIFNGTIEENRNHFPGLWRRRRMGGSPLAAIAEGGHVGSDASMWAVLLRGVTYLLTGSVLFAFLRPERVLHNPQGALAAACFALIVTTAATQLPKWFYIRYLKRSGDLSPTAPGHRLLELHADFWTLAFAALCVVIAYVTEVRPGYAYGIIGVLSVSRRVHVRPDRDRGQLKHWRMEFAGMTTLLIAALACWLAYSSMHGDHEAVIPHMLQEGWALGSETVALGLIPLSFLPGKVLWNWNRPVWAVLWILGMFLYIQSITPAETGAGPLVIAVTIAIYAAITAGFWVYFAYFHDEASCESCRATEPELVEAVA